MATTLEEVRGLVRDPSGIVFDDSQLLAAISASGGQSGLRAAGVAFQSLAAEYALLGKSVRTDDLAIDTRGMGKDLLEVSKAFFGQAADADARTEGGWVGIVPNRGDRPWRPPVPTPAPAPTPSFPVFVTAQTEPEPTTPSDPFPIYTTGA